MSRLRLGIAGVGTVGTALVQLLAQAPELPFEITGLCARNPHKPRGFTVQAYDWVSQPEALLATCDIVVELMGGAEGAAHQLVRSALQAGKLVVTANKALLATHGLELAQLAEAQQSTILWEAAVGGGMPCVAGVRDGLAGRRIHALTGILNGTCNYILSAMQGGQDFASALASAQAQGFAEADPAADIDGHDSACKLALLSALAFGCVPHLPEQVQGIRGLAATAQPQRLLAHARLTSAGLVQWVAPVAVQPNSLLAQTRGVLNALTVHTDAGEFSWQGPGAGGLATAQAVMADLLALARGARPPVFGVPTRLLKTYAADQSAPAGVL